MILYNSSVNKKLILCYVLNTILSVFAQFYLIFLNYILRIVFCNEIVNLVFILIFIIKLIYLKLAENTFHIYVDKHENKYIYSFHIYLYIFIIVIYYAIDRY